MDIMNSIMMCGGSLAMRRSGSSPPPTLLSLKYYFTHAVIPGCMVIDITEPKNPTTTT
jgi:hypothetical protein